MSKRPLRVGLIGAGTVGSALLRLLDRHPEFDVQAVVVRDLTRHRTLGQRSVTLTTDVSRAWDGTDLVVEVAGGVDEPTRWMAEAYARGARLVTANKAAIAERWDTWRPWIEAGRVGFEAAVMAGTPVIAPLAISLRGSHAQRIEAVLNGTCSYLIAEMERGVPFADALAEAQRLGYAEADPSLDIDGWDAAHKITVLARMSVDPNLAWEAVRPHVRGVRDLSPERLARERDAGRRVRLVGFIEPDPQQRGWRVGVEPRTYAEHEPLAVLASGRNAMVYRGDAVGEVWIAGRGAGPEVTASAVLADMLQVARGEPGPSLPQYVPPPAAG